MAKLKLLLDTRAKKKDGSYPVKIRILHKDKQAYLNTEVSIEKDHWNEGGTINRCKRYPTVSRVNHTLQSMLTRSQDIIDSLDTSRRSYYMTAGQIKQFIEKELSGGKTHHTFSEFYIKYMGFKHGKTLNFYEATLNLINKFTGGKTVFFEDITPMWLDKFCYWLEHEYEKGASPNSRITYLSNIRAVFNSAMKERIVSRDLDPFFDYKFPEAVVTHKGLRAKDIKAIFDLKLKEGTLNDLARDTFILSFCLIGINNVDLYEAKKLSSDGRLVYHRSKTGRKYSVMVFPLAERLIKKWKGTNRLLVYAERYAQIKYMNRSINVALKEIGEMVGVSGLTMYYARHSWATIASDLNIPKDTIAESLGHGPKKTTDIYINFDYTKIDQANEQILKSIGLV